LKKFQKLSEKQFEEENVKNFINFFKVLKIQNSEAKPEPELHECNLHLFRKE